LRVSYQKIAAAMVAGIRAVTTTGEREWLKNVMKSRIIIDVAEAYTRCLGRACPLKKMKALIKSILTTLLT